MTGEVAHRSGLCVWEGSSNDSVDVLVVGAASREGLHGNRQSRRCVPRHGPRPLHSDRREPSISSDLGSYDTPPERLNDRIQSDRSASVSTAAAQSIVDNSDGSVSYATSITPANRTITQHGSFPHETYNLSLWVYSHTTPSPSRSSMYGIGRMKGPARPSTWHMMALLDLATAWTSRTC